MNMKSIKPILIALCAAALCGCEWDDAQKVELVELGAVQKSYELAAEGGEIEIPVYSNGKFHIEDFDNDGQWLTLSTSSGSGDQTILAEAGFNEEFKRKAGLVLCSDVDGRRDTIYVKQDGQLAADLRMDNTSVISAGAGGDCTTSVRTNVPFKLMDVDIFYNDEDQDGWVKQVKINEDPTGGENCEMVLTTEPNTGNDPRSAAVTFSFTDGWGDRVAVLVNLVQKNASETLGKEVSFETFKGDFSTGKVIDDFILLSGVVVSNTAGGNAGENEQTTPSAIDYSYSTRTVYLESADGRHGLSLLCETADDNIFNQFDKVQLLLKGAVCTRKENPERYEVKGLTKSMIVSQVKGTRADAPVKEKYIGELTDDDIYTYVTLKDVEIPVRKGAIAPVNEGYTIATAAHRLSKYPRLIRDINGNSSYLMTNSVCVYRSDGSRLPYGSGKMSGVVVHERYSRFEWRQGADPIEMEDDPTLGFIGRYQLRHQTKDDIWGQMKDSVEDSFSALLTEYRFWNPDKNAEVCRPTYGTNGWITHTYQEKYTHDPGKKYTQTTYNQHFWGGGTYAYLGPMGNSAANLFGANYGNKNGIGCVLDMTKEHYSSDMASFVSTSPDGVVEWCGPYASNAYVGCGTGGWTEDIPTNSNQINYSGSTSMRGKSNVSGNCFTSFASNFWWDYDLNRPYAFMVNFSTKGISTSRISMQISVLNTNQAFYTPRYWRAEWSEVDSMDEEYDNRWHTIGDYTVPDVSVWSNALFSSIVAFKHIDFELPLEILGKDNVYVRLRPTSDICSDGSEYANARLSDWTTNNKASNLEYFAIRYNK